MKTSQRQISLFTEDQLTFSQVDSHANHTQAQASDLGKRTSDTSGRICSESFQKLNQPTSWAKTFVDLLIGQEGWSSKKCVLIWKLKGTPYNRYYCQLVPSVRHTEEIEFGLLPTPMAVEAIERRNMKTVIKIVETGSNQITLTTMAKYGGLLPTPVAMDYMINQRELINGKIPSSNSGTAPLKDWASNGLLPTPRTSDKNMHWKTENWKGDDLGSHINEAFGTRSHLNPRFVAEMMGFPSNWTELPFQSGETNQ